MATIEEPQTKLRTPRSNQKKQGFGKPRNLRVLIIDDERRPTPTLPFLSTVELVDELGAPIHQITKWRHALSILCMGVPDFDLILDDVGFGKDDSDPDYPGEDQGIIPPTGVFLGSSFATYAKGRDRPFAVEPYSSIAQKIAEDPIALYHYGIIQICEESIRIEDYRPADFISELKRRVMALPPNMADGAIQNVMPRYRDALARKAKLRATYHITSDSIESAIRVLSKRVEDGSCLEWESGEIGIEIIDRDSRDCICLRSLYADIDPNAATICNVIIPYLRDLKSSIWISDIDWLTVLRSMIEAISTCASNAKQRSGRNGESSGRTGESVIMQAWGQVKGETRILNNDRVRAIDERRIRGHVFSFAIALLGCDFQVRRRLLSLHDIPIKDFLDEYQISHEQANREIEKISNRTPIQEFLFRIEDSSNFVPANIARAMRTILEVDLNWPKTMPLPASLDVIP